MKTATFSFESHCNNQKECIVEKEKIGHIETGFTNLKCLLTDKSQLRFNKSFEKIITNNGPGQKWTIWSD